MKFAVLIALACLAAAQIPADRPSINRVPTPTLDWLTDFENTDPVQFIFVSTDGDDSNPGTMDLPLATLSGARDAVRLFKPLTQGPITVFFREGTYFLEETVEFTRDDNGLSSTQVVTYAAFPGEIVVFSGGIDLNCIWTSDGNVHTCQSESLLLALRLQRLRQDVNVFDAEDFLTLFVNDECAFPARFPNFDFDDPTIRGNGYQLATGGMGRSDDGSFRKFPAQPSSGITYDPEIFSPRVSSWTNTQDARVHIFPEEHWGIMMFTVDEVDTVDNSITFKKGGGQINFYKFNHGTNVGAASEFYIENVLEELDAEREYFFDEDTGLLHYWSEQDPSEQQFILPTLKRLISFQGGPSPADTDDLTNYVQNIVFSDITFTHTVPTYLDRYEAPSGGDWTIVRDGSVYLQTARNIGIHNSLFINTGSNAIFIDGACEDISVLHNEFNQIGESAVAVVGNQQQTSGSALTFPKRVKVDSNLIENIGFFGKQVTGVFVSIAANITITNNFIHDVPRAAIVLNDGFMGGHVVEFNSLLDTVLETSDHGPFNAWGRERYWSELYNHPVANTPAQFPAGPVTEDAQFTSIVRNNRMTLDFHFPSAFGYCIDMDDGTSNFHVYENFVRASTGGVGVKIGASGDVHTVENNIFDGNFDSAVHFWIPTIGNSERFFSNIMVNLVRNFNGDPLNGGFVDLGSLPFFSDFNLYFADGATYTFNFEPLKDWQDETGLEVNSITGQDPLFTDPANDDYTIGPDSPANNIEFHNFVSGHDPDTVGRTQVSQVPDIIAQGIDRPQTSAAVYTILMLLVGISFISFVAYRCAQYRKVTKQHTSLKDQNEQNCAEQEMSPYVRA